jgi:GT2 family glycosyltransferase
MKNNILFIINYNSSNNINFLLQSSDLSVINITHCVIYNNGETPSPQVINSWKINFSKVNITFDVLCNKNDGYGAAINHCINLIKSDFYDYDYAFFSNTDLTIKKNAAAFSYDMYDVVGFPMYQSGNFIVSKITIFTPLIPFRFRKILCFRPEYGSTTIVHGCFFGLRIRSLFEIKITFFENYFLYWEETQFFYEINKLGYKVGVSDFVKINHDGKKSVILDNARYYMFRNGLFFYRYVCKSYTLYVIWYVLNFLYALMSIIRIPFKFPSWYVQGKCDFNNNLLGKRIS